MFKGIGKSSAWLVLPLIIFISPLVRGGATPAAWQVSDADSKVYLLGSMHFGVADFYPLPSSVENAFKSAQALAVEVDVASIDLHSASQLYQKYAALPQGRTLQDMLGAELFKELSRFCKDNDISLQAFEIWQPWFIALQLVQMELNQTKWKAVFGVDMYFLTKKEKPVIELESLEQQFALLGGFSNEEQRMFLSQTLSDLKDSKQYLDTLGQAWQDGDTSALEKLLTRSFHTSEVGGTLYSKFFVERNQEMATQINNFLKANKSVFVVVGAGHMVGEHGIVNLLRQRGHRVTKL